MGGTFDPPHIGHLAIAEEVLSAIVVEEVWLLPTGRIAYKDSQNLSLPRERLAMVRLAVAGHPRFKVNGMEAEREEVSYTYQTLQRQGLLRRPCQPLYQRLLRGYESLVVPISVVVLR